jgi:membrane protein implicated in regulation of membrane protease activity
VIILGIVLLVLALLIPAIHVLFWIGVALIIIGLVLLLLGTTGRPVGGRRYWY